VNYVPFFILSSAFGRSVSACHLVGLLVFGHRLETNNKSSMAPIVSIICVCHDNKKWFERYFQSLREQSILDRLEIMMVDNCSADGSPEILARELSTFTHGVLIKTGGDYGYGIGCNRGAAKARGKYLFFVNPDIWFEADCLQQLVKYAELSTAKIFTLTELPYDRAAAKGVAYGRGAAGFDVFGCLLPPSSPEKHEPIFAVGSFYFIRKDLFQELGGFDSEFFLYNEELDLSWRALIAGETIESIPQARLHHASVGNANSQPKTRESRRFYANRSQLLTILKNSQCLLLLTSLTFLALIAAEAIAGALATRRFSFVYWSLLKPVKDCWRLRFYLLDQRKQIKAYRKRGDWWFIRHFLRFGFQHWTDIKRFIKPGIKIES
jgi:GT2 family glycosyltransferase